MTRYNISLDEESHIIKLLNTKTGHMSDNSQSLFGSSLITSPNNACKNGVVHIIAKAQPYLRNLYEEVEIMHNQWKKDNAISDPEDTMVSMYTFLKKYNADSLDQQRSVSIGVDENGEYIWIDSVMRRNNTILNGLDAMLYTEDSVYSVTQPGKRYPLYRIDNYNWPSQDVLVLDGVTHKAEIRFIADNWLQDKGFTLTYETVTNIEENNGLNNISIYPNPVSSMLNVDLTADFDGQINFRIMDMTGRTISVENLANCGGDVHHTINVSNLSKGMYMLSIEGQNVKSVRKFIVE